ncbi:hypothetical protein T12_6423 [Trichinella patagoniensis]|uniref:Uncharacterized protein n=1 Tax=Trichinella patagoniensis TaxID=990121 RepID=A0A0V0YWH2_9BILA|nr:hypothetical protein T12_6423 [Trichinella patagoniensis]
MEVRGGEGGKEDFSVSVHLFVGLTRECEDCQKIIRRLMVRKQAQKPKITNDIKI